MSDRKSEERALKLAAKAENEQFTPLPIDLDASNPLCRALKRIEMLRVFTTPGRIVKDVNEFGVCVDNIACFSRALGEVIGCLSRGLTGQLSFKTEILRISSKLQEARERLPDTGKYRAALQNGKSLDEAANTLVADWNVWCQIYQPALTAAQYELQVIAGQSADSGVHTTEIVLPPQSENQGQPAIKAGRLAAELGADDFIPFRDAVAHILAKVRDWDKARAQSELSKASTSKGPVASKGRGKGKRVLRGDVNALIDARITKLCDRADTSVGAAPRKAQMPTPRERF